MLPSDFAFVRNEAAGPPQAVEAFIPLSAVLSQTNPQGAYAAIIRARRGTSPEQVAAAVGAVGRAIDARDFQSRGLKLYPVGLKADVISRIRPALVVLGGAGIVLLVMLMVNLASVLLARAAQREHEVAVSRALGANTVAIVRCHASRRRARSALPAARSARSSPSGARARSSRWHRSTCRGAMRSRSTGASAAVVVAVGALLGLLAATVPAGWSARTSLSSLLASSAVRGGGGHGRLRRGMIVAQVALSLVLLSSGALVVRSFERLLRADPGFRSEGVFTIRLRRPPEFFPQMSDAVAFRVRVQEALAAIPGVTGVSATSTLPLTAVTPLVTIRIPGAPGNTGNADRDAVLTDLVGVAANYVEVMGMRLVAGRTFTELRPNGVSEAIIDSALARRFFPDGNAVGATIPLGKQSLTIIGVVDQARLYDVHADGRPQLLMQVDELTRPLSFVIRTTRDPALLLPDVRAAVRRVDPRVPIGDPRPMDEIVEQTLSNQATGAALISAFAIGALLLAAMGLFGVVSGSVTRRRHELAVRLALGADHGRVLRLVLREGAALVLMGVLIGAPGIYLAGGFIRGVLVGVSPSDPLTLLGVALGLLLVTMATCYVPARRALGIEPATLLRQE